MANIKRKHITFGSPRLNTINYIPIDNATIVNGSVNLANRIGYFPIYIDKKINNPNFCMHVTTAGAGVGNIPIGIYNGNNGLDNASVLWSGFLNYSAATGIYKVSPNIVLNEGFYILASCTNVSGSNTLAGIPGIKYTKALFGDSINSIIDFNTTSAFESTGTNLPASIDGNISGNYSSIAPVITIEY